MSWWGKIVGGAFGFMLGGPLGAMFGAALGHNFDKGMQGLEHDGGEDDGRWRQERTQTAFFTATFSVMGHIAKADGRVSEQEIQLAQALMQQMDLTPQHREVAMRLFNEGKRANFPLQQVLDQFRRECHRQRNLIQMFIEIQLQAAYADGDLHANEKHILLELCNRLGFSELEFRRLEAMFRAQQNFGGGRRSGGAGAHTRPASQDELQAAYKILGVNVSDDDAQVKRAYRRLMSQHHPDKLVAKGLPEEMMRIATEKTQEIKAAYDLVRQSRAKN